MAILNVAVEDRVAGWPSLGTLRNVTAPLDPAKALVLVVKMVLGIKLTRAEVMVAIFGLPLFIYATN